MKEKHDKAQAQEFPPIPRPYGEGDGDTYDQESPIADEGESDPLPPPYGES